MLTHKEKWIIGGKKYNQQLHEKLKEEYFKTPKYCLYCDKILDYGIKKSTFCNSKCSCSFNNQKRKDNGFYKKGLKREANCLSCKERHLIGKNASALKFLCAKCRPVHIFEKTCSVCNIGFNAKRKTIKTCGKNCSDIAKRNGGKIGGRVSEHVQSKSRRSKNEIYFSELCANQFKNIKTNEPMFNGWDADIILPDLKIAVLWNGVWHYKKITEKHSVKQVRNRDFLKIKEIKKLGYTPYIIKDMGKYNRKFVKSKFKEFLAGVGIEPNVSY